MSDERFNELIEKATETLEPGRVVEFLDGALRAVVQATEVAGEQALLEYLAGPWEQDSRNAR